MPARRGRGDGGIRQRADGRWEATVDLGWVNGKRVRKYLYGKTRTEVQAKLRATHAAQDRGHNIAAPSRTVGQFLDDWADNVMPGTVGDGSAETYKRVVRLYLKPALGRVSLTQLTPRHVTEMMRSMEARGLSASTQNQARKVLGRALRRAAQEGLVHRNVASLADAPRVVHVEGRAMTRDEVLLLAAELQAERLGAAYLLTVVLGLRRGEVLGLRWDDIDLEEATPVLRVVQQLQRRAKSGLLLTELKTSKSRRTLALPPQAVDALRAWRARQAEERLAVGPGWSDTAGLVFTTPAGTPADPDNFRKRLGLITVRAGLGTWRTHELRKTAGSLLFDMDVPMKLISESLGHSSERITSDVYVRTRSAAKTRVAAAMAEAIWGKSSASATASGEP